MRGRLVVIGAVNTDFVIRAPHLPRPGETVTGDGLGTFGGGKAANAAVAAARAGGDVLLIGAVGDDDAGRAAVKNLQADDVDTAGLAVLDNTPTGAALIVVDATGENQIVLGPGANGALTPAHVVTALQKVLPHAAVVLVSTEIPLACVSAAVAAARAAHVSCILNPAPVVPGLDDVLALGPLLTPNEIELAALADAPSHQTGDVDALLSRVARRTAAPVIVTLGPRGCAARLADGSFCRVAAPTPSTVVDTTGAGDTFNGVFAMHLAAGAAIPDAVRAATVAASLSVTAAGARGGMPRAAAIAAALQRLPPAPVHAAD